MAQVAEVTFALVGILGVAAAGVQVLFRSDSRLAAAVYQELAVLGFITVTLRLCLSLGVVQKLNDRIFGVSETELAALREFHHEGVQGAVAPTQLKEIFELIHVFVFVVMILFILQALVLAAALARLTKQVPALSYTYPSGAELPSARTWKYHALQKRFRGQAGTGLSCLLSRADPYARDANFTHYIHTVVSEQMAEAIELPASSLLALLALVVLLYPFFLLRKLAYVAGLAICGLYLLLIHIIQQRVTAAAVAECVPPQRQERLRPLSTEPVDPQTPPAWDAFKNYDAPIDNIPPVQFDFRNRPRSATDTLFPFKRPKHFMRVLQLSLVCTAAYISINLLTITNASPERDETWGARIGPVPVAWLLGPQLVLVFIAGLWLWRSACEGFALVTATDYRINRHELKEMYVHKLVKETATDEAVWRRIMLRSRCVVGGNLESDRINEAFGALPILDQQMVQAVFVALTSPNQLTMPKSRLPEAMKLLGLPCSDNQQVHTYEAQRSDSVLMTSLSDLVGRQPVITLDEFIFLVVSGTVRPHAAPAGLVDDLNGLFDILDSEHGGQLTSEEVQKAIRMFAPTVSESLVVGMTQRLLRNEKTIEVRGK